MALPNVKLAESLRALKTLQDTGKKVIRGRELSRTHQARLVAAGFLELVVKGWYLPARPGGELPGGTAAWYAGMRDFVAGYCDERFGGDWHLSPEQPLVLWSGERTLSPQLQIWAPKANNQMLALPHGCSLYLYRAPALMPGVPHPDNKDIRVVDLAAALAEVAESFFLQRRLAATICLGMVKDVAPRHHARRGLHRAGSLPVRPASGHPPRGADRVALRAAPAPDVGRDARRRDRRFPRPRACSRQRRQDAA